MTTSSLFHTDIQRLWKHSPFKVPADTPPSNASNQYEHMILTFTAIITWTNLHTYTRENDNNNNNKVYILSHTIPFPSSTSTHTHTHARTHRIWSSPLLGLWCPEASTEDQIENPACLHWPDFVSVWIYLHYGPAVLTMTEKPELRYYKDFSKSLSGCEKKSNKCVPRGSIWPGPGKEYNLWKKTAFFFHTKSDTIQKRCILKRRAETAECTQCKKHTYPYTQAHTHTHTHAHMVHILP